MLVALSAEEFVNTLFQIAEDFESALSSVHSTQDLEELRVAYLGRKGKVAQILGRLPELAAFERPEAGKKANEIKKRLQNLHDQRRRDLAISQEQRERQQFDATLPGRTPWLGSVHPVTRVMDEICDVFTCMGFDVVNGPEVETDFYNFEALNIPPNHPARDMQDTLYVTESILLRTHTSPLQIRTMLQRKPPLAVIAPGKVYRRDADLTHTPMFHQIEGFLVDHEVTMADLRGALTCFVHKVFSPETRIRFRPSFFPFTEPSAEVDISCVICGGRGQIAGQPCRVCKQTGWVEILGCGMIDPKVFQAVDYDQESYTGFAFGLGVERVVMLKYGIDDLRLFFDNDTRFLNQFRQMPFV
jgi:phenylalanyl-tRNA synthetase alpha chain